MSLVQHTEREEAEGGQSLHKITTQQLQTDVTNVLEIQSSAQDQMKASDSLTDMHFFFTFSYTIGLS